MTTILSRLLNKTLALFTFSSSTVVPSQGTDTQTLGDLEMTNIMSHVGIDFRMSYSNSRRRQGVEDLGGVRFARPDSPEYYFQNSNDIYNSAAIIEPTNHELAPSPVTTETSFSESHIDLDEDFVHYAATLRRTLGLAEYPVVDSSPLAEVYPGWHQQLTVVQPQRTAQPAKYRWKIPTPSFSPHPIRMHLVSSHFKPAVLANEYEGIGFILYPKTGSIAAEIYPAPHSNRRHLQRGDQIVFNGHNAGYVYELTQIRLVEGSFAYVELVAFNSEGKYILESSGGMIPLLMQIEASLLHPKFYPIFRTQIGDPVQSYIDRFRTITSMFC